MLDALVHIARMGSDWGGRNGLVTRQKPIRSLQSSLNLGDHRKCSNLQGNDMRSLLLLEICSACQLGVPRASKGTENAGSNVTCSESALCESTPDRAPKEHQTAYLQQSSVQTIF